MSARGPSVKYLVSIESDSYGDLFFGPYATEEKAQREAAKFEKAGRDGEFWSVRELQPGSYAPEWRRIFREGGNT